MALAAIADMAGYLRHFAHDPRELELLAKDLLINVTSFFRDPRDLRILAKTIVPGLVREHSRTGRSVSGWPAAARARRPIPSRCSFSRRSRRRSALSSCRSSRPTSTGMRLRSLAMASIPIRSRRTCRREAWPLLHQGRSELSGRARVARVVVFTVQDVLADPPFSRLDLVSCRNLLIYLRPEAQEKVVPAVPFRAA